MKQFTLNQLKSFSKKNRTTIADIFIEGVIEHKGKKGVVSFELNESGELIGLGYKVIDRRKLKFANLSAPQKNSINTIPIYWEIIKDGERATAAKELFTLPIFGQYHSLCKVSSEKRTSLISFA